SRFLYTGQMSLPEAELYHYKARTYAPNLGRFLQADPIGYAAGMNLYAYVGGDPINATDSSELIKDSVCTTRTGLRIRHCVTVETGSENKLTYRETIFVESNFSNFIWNNDNLDISENGTKVPGSPDKKEIELVSQFVGTIFPGVWSDTSIQDATNGQQKLDQSTAGKLDRSWVRDRDPQTGYTMRLNMNFMKGIMRNNASALARTMIHEILHRDDLRGLIFGHNDRHRSLDAEAIQMLNTHGLAGGGCPSIPGRWTGDYFFFEIGPSYPGCD
ncbi:RHS repeat-associated core domain-containing protein, partial [Paremcibacter congregatus]